MIRKTVQTYKRKLHTMTMLGATKSADRLSREFLVFIEALPVDERAYVSDCFYGRGDILNTYNDLLNLAKSNTL